MAIELTTSSSPAVAATTRKAGCTTFDLPGGKALTIETTPDGVELLNAEPEAGKAWRVGISVDIIETDA